MAKERNMGFVVTRPGGSNDPEFQTYARLLRQRGADLGNLPRIRDPFSGQRWLYVWNTQTEAAAFAEDLKQQTGDPAWAVVEVRTQASEGPLGPVVIQLVRQADGFTFGLHALSQVLIRSAFPQAVRAITYATIDTPTWYDFRKRKGDLGELVRAFATPLTGLTCEQLETIGYVVVDADSDRTLVSVPATLLGEGQDATSSSGHSEVGGPGSVGGG